jgi:hypothetical protein
MEGQILRQRDRKGEGGQREPAAPCRSIHSGSTKEGVGNRRTSDPLIGGPNSPAEEEEGNRGSWPRGENMAPTTRRRGIMEFGGWARMRLHETGRSIPTPSMPPLIFLPSVFLPSSAPARAPQGDGCGGGEIVPDPTKSDQIKPPIPFRPFPCPIHLAAGVAKEWERSRNPGPYTTRPLSSVICGQFRPNQGESGRIPHSFVIHSFVRKLLQRRSGPNQAKSK